MEKRTINQMDGYVPQPIQITTSGSITLLEKDA